MSEKHSKSSVDSSATESQSHKMQDEQIISTHSSLITHHSSFSPMAWLESRMMFGMKAGLENMQVVCGRLGNPQLQLKTIHVVGTNGKGSTSFWMMRILEAHGLRTGLFTSPHLVSVRERIRIGDLAISQDDFERILAQVQQASHDREITFFEVLTAVALVWFAEQKLDAVVLEGGLGGRLDSTNIADSSVCILTSIGFDHMEILGNTTEQILHEKLGVWKRGAQLFLNLSEENLLQMVRERAQALPAQFTQVPSDYAIRLAQPGNVYKENASLALAGAKAFLGNVFQATLANKALENAVWVGRMQVLRNSESGEEQWLLDGAHNGHAARRLAESLAKDFPNRKFPMLLAVLKTKDPMEILEPVLPFVDEICITRTPHEKMREPAEIRDLLQARHPSIPVHCLGEVKDAIHWVQTKQTLALCTGSLYFVGAVIEQLKDQYAELAWFRQFAPTDNERK